MNVMKAALLFNYNTQFKQKIMFACTHSDRNLNIIPTVIRTPHTNPPGG